MHCTELNHKTLSDHSPLSVQLANEIARDTTLLSELEQRPDQRVAFNAINSFFPDNAPAMELSESSEKFPTSNTTEGKSLHKKVSWIPPISKWGNAHASIWL